MSHMAVQTRATARNQQAEALVDFVLQRFSTRLFEEGYTTAASEPLWQVSFQRDDCSDVFDHMLEIELKQDIGGGSGTIELWGQTTCYKGNETGRPESNKVYETRETLIESLGLRRWLREEEVPFRTFHATIGPASYAYGWTKDAKDNAFDLSMYPDPSLGAADVFRELEQHLKDASDEEVQTKLAEVIEGPNSDLKRLMLGLESQLYSWFTSGMKVSPMADLQADLLDTLRNSRTHIAANAIAASKGPGADIKEKALRYLYGEETNDDALVRTVRRLLRKNPFLSTAVDAYEDWDAWSAQHFRVPKGADLKQYVVQLWNLSGSAQLISRRLLLRIHTDETVEYVQDVGIEGLTEHTLYGGTHTAGQVDEVSEQIVGDCVSSGITTPQQLYERMAGKRGKRLLAMARYFESKNGTQIRPSFDYVEVSLEDRYTLHTFGRSSLDPPVAYYSSFSDSTVRPYQNMKVVIDKASGQPVAILKAKFFSEREFARRVKEEAYPGLTTKYDLRDGDFIDGYPGLPLIMFVDMVEDFTPPEYAVRKLVETGWDAFFSIDELRRYLDAKGGGRGCYKSLALFL